MGIRPSCSSHHWKVELGRKRTILFLDQSALSFMTRQQHDSAILLWGKCKLSAGLNPKPVDLFLKKACREDVLWLKPQTVQSQTDAPSLPTCSYMSATLWKGVDVNPDNTCLCHLGASPSGASWSGAVQHICVCVRVCACMHVFAL